MRFLSAFRPALLLVVVMVASMGQRCPTEPSPAPCSLTPAPERKFAQADLDRAREDGYRSGQDACPAAPEPEPCPACDVTVNDDDVGAEAVDEFVRSIMTECSFGSSVAADGNIDREVKRRIAALHQYGRCR